MPPLAPQLYNDAVAGNGSYKLPPWIYPPAEFVPIDQVAYVPIPAIGSTATIVSIPIPPGHNAIIKGLANNFVGAGWTEGSGEVVWQILRDNAAVDGYDNILASLGSPANPVIHPSGFRVINAQLLTLVVKNVSVVLAGQVSGGRLMGWYYPMEYEDPSINML